MHLTIWGLSSSVSVFAKANTPLLTSQRNYLMFCPCDSLDSLALPMHKSRPEMPRWQCINSQKPRVPRVQGWNTPNHPNICLWEMRGNHKDWEMRSPKHPKNWDILGLSHFHWSESLERRISAHHRKRTGFRDNTNRASLPCRPQNCDKKSPLAPEERVTSLWLASHSLD